MANGSMLNTQKMHMVAHPVDNATPPQPIVAGSGVTLNWSIFSQSSGLGATIVPDADTFGATVQCTGQSGTFSVRWAWSVDASKGDSSNIAVSKDTSGVSGGTTSFDDPVPK